MCNGSRIHLAHTRAIALSLALGLPQLAAFAQPAGLGQPAQPAAHSTVQQNGQTAMPTTSAPHAVQAPARPAPTAAAPAALVDGKPTEARGNAKGAARPTIGQLTQLAEELKVAKMQREIRDAKKDTTTGSSLPGAAAFQPAPTGVAIPRASAVKPVAVSPSLTLPRLEAITSIGGVVRARLQDGREIVAGQKLYSGGKTWTVKSVTTASVLVESCDSPAAEPPKATKASTKKPSSAVAPAPACTTVGLIPGG